MRNNKDRKIIYIRHGEDTREDYKYDESLTKRGKKEVEMLTSDLISEHGVPDIIYYSPYYRTRQTKRIMLKVIDKYFKEVVPSTICDIRLSRFFTKKQSYNPDIRRDTRKKGAPLKETRKEFKYRIRKQLSEIISEKNHKIIWCVTHTLVLDYLINNLNIEHEHEIPFLDTIVLPV